MNYTTMPQDTKQTELGTERNVGLKRRHELPNMDTSDLTVSLPLPASRSPFRCDLVSLSLFSLRLVVIAAGCVCNSGCVKPLYHPVRKKGTHSVTAR